MSLQRTAVNNPVTTALVFVAIAIFGIYSLINLSINQLPDMETNFIMVMTSYPGASAEDGDGDKHQGRRHRIIYCCSL